ncbi:MAG: DUF937 domain-containing protein [Polyangiales bacterium]
MELLDVIKSTGGISALAQQLGLSESQAQTGAAALLPAIVAGFQKQTQGGGGLEGLVSMLGQAGGAGLLENVLGSEPTNTKLGGDLLGQIFGSKDVSREVAGQAASSTGLNVETLKKMLPILTMLAGGLLAKRGGQGGGLLDQLGGLLGGSSGGAVGGLGKLLDQDGNGNPLDDVLRGAGKLFGR